MECEIAFFPRHFPVNSVPEALALRKFFSTAVTFSASAIALAPSSPMEL